MIILRYSMVSVFRQRQLFKVPHLAKEPFNKITLLYINLLLTHFSPYTEYYTSNLIKPLNKNTLIFFFYEIFQFQKYSSNGQFSLVKNKN